MKRFSPLLLTLFLYIAFYTACNAINAEQFNSNEIIISAIPEVAIDEYEMTEFVRFTGLIKNVEVIDRLGSVEAFSDTSRFHLLLRDEQHKSEFLTRVGIKKDGEKQSQLITIAKDSVWYFVGYN